MASTTKFDPNNTIKSSLTEKSLEELFKLASGICACVIDRTGGNEYRGGIYPDNISISDDGEVILGPVTEGEAAEEEKGFLAPELASDVKPGSSADVYSIGMLLYYAVSDGKLPEDESFEIPEKAGKYLSQIIRKATAANAAERYSSVSKLMAVLDLCIAHLFSGDGSDDDISLDIVSDDLSEIERGVGIVSETGAVVGAIPELKEYPNPELEPIVVDRSAAAAIQLDQATEREKNIADKVRRRRRRPIIFIAILCALLVGTALIYGGVTGDAPHTAPPVVTPTVTDTPAPVETPPVTPTPTVPVDPVVIEHSYQLFIEDVSWERAAELCREKGGYLVTVNDEVELKRIIALTESYGINMVWIGGCRVDGAIVWESGESVEFYEWDFGEPSYRDTYDGAAEDYMLLWNHNGWVYNDSRNDPIAYYPNAYSGKIAYICEFDG